jgi:hypothetical protein
MCQFLSITTGELAVIVKADVLDREFKQKLNLLAA